MHDIEKMLLSFEFTSLGYEFSYLKESIEILINNYEDNFNKHDLEFKEEIQKLKENDEYDEPIDEEYAPSITLGMLAEYEFEQPKEKLETLSSMIIESLIIKHISYIEKILVKLSFTIQKKEKEVVPPDYYINSHFTDMIRAVDYIKLITNNRINIKIAKKWKVITNLRQIRHKLAHGENTFVFNQGTIDDINKEINILLVYDKRSEGKEKDKTNLKCGVVSNISILLKLNKVCIDFVDEIEQMLTTEYVK